EAAPLAELLGDSVAGGAGIDSACRQYPRRLRLAMPAPNGQRQPQAQGRDQQYAQKQKLTFVQARFFARKMLFPQIPHCREGHQPLIRTADPVNDQRHDDRRQRCQAQGCEQRDHPALRPLASTLNNRRRGKSAGSSRQCSICRTPVRAMRAASSRRDCANRCKKSARAAAPSTWRLSPVSGSRKTKSPANGKSRSSQLTMPSDSTCPRAAASRSTLIGSELSKPSEITTISESRAIRSQSGCRRASLGHSPEHDIPSSVTNRRSRCRVPALAGTSCRTPPIPNIPTGSPCMTAISMRHAAKSLAASSLL